MESTTSTIVSPLDLKITETRAGALYDRISQTKITDVSTYDLIGTLLLEVKRMVNVIEEAFGPVVNQAYKTHKAMLALQKKALERLEEAETLAGDKLKHFHDQHGSHNLPILDGISFRELWSGEVTHPDLIPREYLIPDTKKLMELTKVLKQETNIPGWTVRERKSIAVKA